MYRYPETFGPSSWLKRRKKKLDGCRARARSGSRTLAKSFMESFSLTSPRVLGGGKFRRGVPRHDAAHISYIILRDEEVDGFRVGGCRYVPPTTVSRASERTNVTAGGCLRNPLSCYTLRPSIAARTKNTRALPRRTERLGR